MKIGILLCGHPADEIIEKYGNFHAMFKRLLNGQGLELVAYDVEAMEFPSNPSECDGWLISGSKHGAYEDHPFIPPLEAFIRKVSDINIPMVGICFGHQIIAQALGGRVEKFKAGWFVGHADYDLPDGGKLALNAWHQDQVITPPKHAKTTASSGFCAHAALVYPNGIWTLQPHPEFDNELIREYLKIRGAVAGVPKDLLESALSGDPKPIDNRDIARRIGEHFKKFAKVEHV